MCRPPWIARIAGSRWRSPGMAFARSACPRSLWPPFPTSSARGWAPRADILGDTGADAPERWVGSAGEDLHAIAILFSRTDEQCRRSIAGARQAVGENATASGVCRSWTSTRHRHSTTPMTTSASATGYRSRDRRGPARNRTPGSGAALASPASSSSAIPTKTARSPIFRRAGEALSRNGSYMAYRRLQEHVGALSAYYSAEHADTAGG